MNSRLAKKQQEILEKLLQAKQGLTADELVDLVGITKTAVKEHLNVLVQLGFLIFEDEKGGVGRPRRKYLLSEAGQDYFPKQYSWLSKNILELLSQTMTSTELNQFMINLANKVSAEIENSESPAGEDRFQKLIRIMNELGYNARLSLTPRAQGAIVEAFNCVYHKVAQEHPQLCQFDIRLIQRNTGMDVVLETCIARGGDSCRFCLSPRKTTNP